MEGIIEKLEAEAIEAGEVKPKVCTLLMKMAEAASQLASKRLVDKAATATSPALICSNKTWKKEADLCFQVRECTYN